MEKDIYIESCEEFLEPKTGQILFFSEYIINKVESLVKDDEYIGVHMRRTDNQMSIESSTTEAFINKMDELVHVNENQKFYVASDSKDEVLRSMEYFPNKIVAYKDKTLDRRAVQGGIDAAIDLYCLSKSKMILGSKGSSFSIEAAKMGRIPLFIVEK